MTKFVPQRKNVNRHTEHGERLLRKSLEQDGWLDAQTAAADGEMISGSMRLEVAADKFADVEPIIVESDGSRPVIVVRTDIPNLDDPRAKRLSVAANQIAKTDYNPDGELLKEWANEDKDIRAMFADSEWQEVTGEEKPTVDAEPQIDRAAELLEKWQVKTGDLWQLGEHRLICGDCTDKAVVERVMNGEKAILVHADPPYGMGKENEGIENDNLYRDKLDSFQMQWFEQCRAFIRDNAGYYIWGTAEDLWRLWFTHLFKRERMTFRNEIVWDKASGQGMGSAAHRMYPTASERCLFFVLGEQGWNNNADNYWEGFTPIVEYLENQRAIMKWSIKDTKRIAGHSEKSGCHWFDKSQWTMPTEETYNAWRLAANGNAFHREYDDLRREWYATRAPFDNTHDLMTDVWRYGTMRGDERPDHPTPKPVEMIERIIKTSGTDDAVTYSPFVGSGTDIISGQNCGRSVYGCEISPAYVAVALERFAQAFPNEEIRRLE